MRCPLSPAVLKCLSNLQTHNRCAICGPVTNRICNGLYRKSVGEGVQCDQIWNTVWQKIATQGQESGRTENAKQRIQSERSHLITQELSSRVLRFALGSEIAGPKMALASRTPPAAFGRSLRFVLPAVDAALHSVHVNVSQALGFSSSAVPQQEAREALHYDLCIVGAGPAGLSAGIRFKQVLALDSVACSASSLVPGFTLANVQ